MLRCGVNECSDGEEMSKTLSCWLIEQKDPIVGEAAFMSGAAFCSAPPSGGFFACLLCL